MQPEDWAAQGLLAFMIVGVSTTPVAPRCTMIGALCVVGLCTALECRLLCQTRREPRSLLRLCSRFVLIFEAVFGS